MRIGVVYDELLLSKSADWLDRPAIVRDTETISYRELIALIESFAEDLVSQGLRPEERVLLLLPNSPEFVVAFLAVTAAGGIVVPIDPAAGLERLQFVVDDTSAKLCLHLRASPPPEGLRIPKRVIDAGASPTSIPSHPTPSSKSVASKGAESTPSDRSGSGGRDRFLPPEIGPESPAVILYTAGSTGRPKGVVLEHGQLLAIADTLVSVIGMNPDHRDLILSPMTHSGGWQRVTSTFRSGGCVVLPSGAITVPLILETVRTRNVTGFFATPPLLRAILMSPAEKVARSLEGLGSIETASAPFGSQEMGRLVSLLPHTKIFMQYGLTECSRALMFEASERPDKLHTVGRPTRNVSVIVAGEDGARLETGAEGEILLAAPQCAKRYWNKPDLDRERLRNGWLATGDFGKLDADGFLALSGRRDDMINCGGHSYFPAEVEMELGPYDAAREYMIAGVPDPQKLLHQVPWAFLVPRDPREWSSERFLAWAKAKLPAHKVPRRAVMVPSLPSTPTGKQSRRVLVQMYGPDAGKAPA